MTTARDIIASALEDVGIVGVGQTPLAEDMNYGLVRLNRMIGQFNERRWLVFHLVDAVAQTTGNASYTVGPGGVFNVASGRPDKLEDGCFFRQFVTGAGNSSYPVDYPLTLLEAREDYNRIALKNMASWPSFIYYDAAMPLGNLYINPVPTAGQFEIHILIKDALATLANLSTVLATPPAYEEAFEYNLALRFCAKYQIEATREIAGLARAALSTIRSANTQIPLQELPAALTGSGRRYNIYSDRSN